MKTNLLYFFFLPLFCWSQITTDRPGEGISSDIISAKTFQLESGATYSKTDKSFNSDHLLRFGVTKNSEIRLETDQNFTNFTESSCGFSSKINILENQQSSPSLTLIAVSNFKFDEYSFSIASEKEITQNLSASTNIGYKKEMQDFLFFSFGFVYVITLKWGILGEYYGNYNPTFSPDHNADLALTFLASKRMQLDIAMGSNSENISKNYYLSTGVSFKFK